MITIQQLLNTYIPQLLASRKLSSDMRRAAVQLRDCRTAAMGGHINSCPNGHEHHIAYNSCRHRLCSVCNGLPRARWLAKWKRKLLPVPHHHIVFTTPQELVNLWRYNKVTFANTLFAAATKTLNELLADPKYLGARPGILACLHTWSQTLAAHVHLHVLVTAGGLDEKHQWQVPKKDCLLPRKVLMIKFRGVFRAMLLSQLNRGELLPPPGTSIAYWRSQLHRVGRMVWNVKLFDRYAHGSGVATYLAQYMRGGPIGNHRLLSVKNDRVLFRYRLPSSEHHEKPQHSLMRMDAMTFLTRLLEHTPPRGFQTVRGYGLYSGNQHSQIAEAHHALGNRQYHLQSPELTWQQFMEQAGATDSCRCSVCGELLQTHSYFVRGREPPSQALEVRLVQLSVA